MTQLGQHTLLLLVFHCNKLTLPHYMSLIVLCLHNFTAYTIVLPNISAQYHLHTLYQCALSGKTHFIAPCIPLPANTYTSLTTNLIALFIHTRYVLPIAMHFRHEFTCASHLDSHSIHSIILTYLPGRTSNSIALSSFSTMCRQRTNRFKYISNHPIFIPLQLSICLHLYSTLTLAVDNNSVSLQKTLHSPSCATIITVTPICTNGAITTTITNNNPIITSAPGPSSSPLSPI